MQHQIIDTENHHNTEPKRYLCRHIFTDGHRCGSICLRGEHFCYYHHTTRRPAANPKQRRSRRATFELPLPEDRSAVQASIGLVLQRIAANDIDPRRASLILYGLSIAASNLPKAAPHSASQSRNRNTTPPPEQVEEITTHPDLGTLAPQSEFNPPEERLSLAGRLIAELRKNPCTCQQNPNPEESLDHQPATPNQQLTTDNRQLATNNILPSLNAVAMSEPKPLSSNTLRTFCRAGGGRRRTKPSQISQNQMPAIGKQDFYLVKENGKTVDKPDRVRENSSKSLPTP